MYNDKNILTIYYYNNTLTSYNKNIKNSNFNFQ